MDNGNFTSGLQRLRFLYNEAVEDKRWQSADKYVEAIWEHTTCGPQRLLLSCRDSELARASCMSSFSLASRRPKRPLVIAPLQPFKSAAGNAFKKYEIISF
jgi:hypothetical protein